VVEWCEWLVTTVALLYQSRPVAIAIIPANWSLDINLSRLIYSAVPNPNLNSNLCVLSTVVLKGHVYVRVVYRIDTTHLVSMVMVLSVYQIKEYEWMSPNCMHYLYIISTCAGVYCINWIFAVHSMMITCLMCVVWMQFIYLTFTDSHCHSPILRHVTWLPPAAHVYWAEFGMRPSHHLLLLGEIQSFLE